jgi:hypothetical protein
MSRADKRLTAADIVLLAASELGSSPSAEFSEWELSVATWKRDANRFGMRGFEADHPDHKRVMKEIMGKTGAVQRGLLEKSRPNYYRMSALGRAAVSRLGGAQQSPAKELRSVSVLYDDIAKFTDHRVFSSWLRDPAEPRTWLGASAFLRIAKHDPNELNKCLRTPRERAADGLAWCDSHGRDQLTRGPVGGGKGISRIKLQKLVSFVDVLETRFEAQINAIKSRGEQAGSP